MIKPETKKEVNRIFSKYLDDHSLRKTRERFAMLDEVYSLNDHFDADSLFLQMKNKKHTISRATIYNTIDLLLNCDLITKHQFGKNLAKYEKSFEYKQHDHLICEDCSHIFEFCDPRLQQIQSMMGELLKFKVTHHSLNLYGKCTMLAGTGNCQYRK